MKAGPEEIGGRFANLFVMPHRLALFVLCLGVALSTRALAIPEGYWLRAQSGVTMVSTSSRRAVYVITGSGEKVLAAWRERMLEQRWRQVSAVYSGPLRHLRLRRDAAVVDATLQLEKRQGRLTVTSTVSRSHAAPVDHAVQGDERKETWVSNGGAVVVNANRCELTLKGDVSVVRVNGDHNEVTIRGTVAAILVRGKDNYVTWSGARNRLAPVVTELGAWNQVRRQ